MKETPVSRIIEVNPIPVEVFLLEKSFGEEDFLPLLESTKFSKEKFIDPFLLCGHKTAKKDPWVAFYR